MMKSAVEVINGPMVGVIMTGMGKDGLEGLKLLKKKEGYVIAQDEETCVVYGMPKAVVDEGLADAVVPLGDIPRTLAQAFNSVDAS
jgi:two-component system chemotaxis response regulator CheB